MTDRCRTNTPMSRDLPGLVARVFRTSATGVHLTATTVMILSVSYLLEHTVLDGALPENDTVSHGTYVE